MNRGNRRILTTHPGRLPNPENQAEILEARMSDDQKKFDSLVKAGIQTMIQKQKAAGIDIMSDGEFWKARDKKYYDSRATGIDSRPLKEGEWPTLVAIQRERRMPEFKQFWEIYSAIGNTPMPGVVNQAAGQRWVIREELKPLGPAAIEQEIGVVKDAIAAAGEKVENFFFPVLGPGWLGHFLLNEHYKKEEDYVYALADFFKADYKAVVDAGFVLQIDDPGLCDKWGMFEPPITVAQYRKQSLLRIEATNWAIKGLPEDRIQYHTCWGSWHTPHTTDIPFKHVIDLLLKVNTGGYSVEASDVRHELDWHLWEEYRLPEGKVYIPGVIAHKTTTIEPPELVAERIVRYANLMGRENVIAGVDCGLGGRVYPDIAWAKLRSLSEGAALASKQLWPRVSRKAGAAAG